MTPVDLGKGTMSVLPMDVTSQHISMSISPAKIPVRKFQAVKRYGTQISLDLTVKISSQVKVHGSYGLKIFREDVKLFKG